MQVSKLHLHCIRKCGWKGTWSKMKEHLKECGPEKKGKVENQEREREGERRCGDRREILEIATIILEYFNLYDIVHELVLIQEMYLC